MSENWWIQFPVHGQFHNDNEVRSRYCFKAVKPLLQEHRSGAYAAQIVMKPEFYEKTLEKLDFIVSLIGEACWTEFSKRCGTGSARNFLGNDTLGQAGAWHTFDA